MSMAIGALVCSIAVIGKHLSLTKSLLVGLAITLLYPTFIIAMVRFSLGPIGKNSTTGLPAVERRCEHIFSYYFPWYFQFL